MSFVPWLVSSLNARVKATFVYAYANVFGGDTNHGAESRGKTFNS